MPETLFVDAIVCPAPRPVVEGQDWYALHTRVRRERKICAQVEGKGHEAYVPVLRQRHRWSDRLQSVDVPMFPGYVFVRAVDHARDRLAILQTGSVHGFVTFGGAAARIPDRQIADLRRLEDQSASCSPWPFLTAGQRVRIRGGCLEGLEGIFVGEGSHQRLVISILPMQRSIAVAIEEYDFEVIGSKRID